ncbi:hypothetical protein [Polaromonas sp.]|uniref:hypothetical protein n=1 Tax=Polaromonas sp. TaxID=1869339 RepID=UPI003BB670A1
MTRKRRAPWITVLFALVSLLFMQLAVASYACPEGASKVAQTKAMAEADMPCTESMGMAVDESQPSLCHAHCQASQQSAEKYQVPLAIDVGLLPSGLTLDVSFAICENVLLQAPYLQRTTAPPLAIQNCCLRL